MKLNRGAIFLALALAGCSGGNSDRMSPVDTNYADANEWQIGPIIDGKNYSHNVPPHPMQAGNSWSIEFPNSDGVHYVTADTGPLTLNNTIILAYRVEADPGAQFVASSAPTTPAMGPTLYFERCNDDWSGTGQYETYRWWATFATPFPMVPGTFQVSVPMNGKWTAVMSSNAQDQSAAFQAALANACRIGFTFGGGTGYGHGAFVTGGHGRVIVDSFKVM